MEGWVPVAAALVLGAILAAGGSLAIETYRNKLVRRAGHRERREQIEDHFRAEQRNLLLQLQEAGAKLLEAADRAIDEKSAAYIRDGLWSEEQFDQTVRQARRSSRALAEQLAVRVYNDNLRAKALYAIRLETDVTSAQSQADALSALKEMRTCLMEANELLGDVLRSLS